MVTVVELIAVIVVLAGTALPVIFIPTVNPVVSVIEPMTLEAFTE